MYVNDISGMFNIKENLQPKSVCVCMNCQNKVITICYINIMWSIVSLSVDHKLILIKDDNVYINWDLFVSGVVSMFFLIKYFILY